MAFVTPCITTAKRSFIPNTVSFPHRKQVYNASIFRKRSIKLSLNNNADNDDTNKYDDLPSDALFKKEELEALQNRIDENARNENQSIIPNLDRLEDSDMKLGELRSGETSIEAVMETVSGFPQGCTRVWVLSGKTNSQEEYFTMDAGQKSKLLLAFERSKDAEYFLALLLGNVDASQRNQMKLIDCQELHDYCQEKGFVVAFIPVGGLDDSISSSLEDEDEDVDRSEVINTDPGTYFEAKKLEKLFESEAEDPSIHPDEK
mmetsp:Transcript_9486/g.17110  ORF Transcript_9486/g.17110 Transcript_9486/m.17110 type:complete len:261 (-) Transcript_9486:484-1266(-)|eukprot:CAMPEP_0182443248 /NCGR_PEP_ID=MMETSP1172-20130603/2024_1 /TAXON_ID=708627 /ORGANISM="Timspurckia oligopyrenoides, Strain CCMP3278" /LENGTH=260 /DNA_ID=CAMNT_0024638449 /DNA_START=93 /DNA_END=875 /DNA_ORIENTATION=-